MRCLTTYTSACQAQVPRVIVQLQAAECASPSIHPIMSRAYTLVRMLLLSICLAVQKGRQDFVHLGETMCSGYVLLMVISVSSAATQELLCIQQDIKQVKPAPCMVCMCTHPWHLVKGHLLLQSQTSLCISSIILSECNSIHCHSSQLLACGVCKATHAVTSVAALCAQVVCANK